MSQSPRVLGNRYEVGDLLGRGGMAEVHLGRDTRLGRVVAIKLLRTDLARDPIFQARFRREAQSAAGLNHPAIVAVYDTGEEQMAESGGGTVSLPYIVMEYVEGRTLRDLLRDGRPLDVHQALEITAGVLSALDYSHRMGIVHRDIKPANVMLTADGDIKVMDFGIARALADVSATMTQTQAVIGTAQYLSPEQARGETVDARSDLYSAGCMLYELVTTRPPFVADSPVAVAYQHVREQPQPPSVFNPLIPEVVDRVVLHALTKDREGRYQTASEFRADLEAAIGGRAVTAPGGIDPRQNEMSTEYLGAHPETPRAGYPYEAAEYGYRQGYQEPTYPPTGQADYRGRPSRGGGNRKAGYAVLALAVVALFAGATYFAFSLVSQNSVEASVTVPQLTGYTEEQATTQLEALGLKVTTATENSDTIKEDLVTRTDPTAEATAATGDTVTVYLSLGPETATVPDLSGMTQDEASSALEEVGLTLGNVEEVSDSGSESGTVVKSDPTSGTSVDAGSSVSVYLASGKITIPDVTGKNVEDAKSELIEAGVATADITVQLSESDATEGEVIAQDPQGDQEYDEGTKVTLYTATPPATESSTDAGDGGEDTGDTGDPAATDGGDDSMFGW